MKYRLMSWATSIGKKPNKNEDRALYTESCLALADGVGCWANLGVDSGKFAQDLVSNCVQLLRESS